MGTPLDWEREARNIGIISAPPANQQFQSPQEQAADNSEAELNRMRRERQVARERDALFNEEEEERQLKSLARQANTMRYQNQIDAMSNPQNDGGGSQVEMFKALIANLDADKRELMADLRDARRSNESTIPPALMTQMSAMQQQLERLSMPSQHAADPIGQLVETFNKVSQVRNALDQAMPAPVPVDTNMGKAERLEQMRIEHEFDLRREKMQQEIEDAKAARSAADEDRRMKQHRADRATDLVENTLAPIVAAFGGDKIASMVSGKPSGEAAVAQVPYVCPNPECKSTNYVPEGTDFATCPHCAASFPLTPIPPEPDFQV